MFAEKCVDGIEANRAGTDASAGATLAVATALNGAIGYDKGTRIVQKATATGRPLREVALEAGRRREAVRRDDRPAQDRGGEQGLIDGLFGSVHAPIRAAHAAGRMRQWIDDQFAGSALNSCATVTAAGLGMPA